MNLFCKNAPLLGFLALAAVGSATPTYAGTVITTTSLGTTVTTTGSINFLKSAPLGSIMSSNTEITGFQEQQGFILPTALKVDINKDGDYYDGTNGIIPSHGKETIAAGTDVNSFFLQSDPVSTKPVANYVGSITFTQPILGIEVYSAGLASSESILGAPTTTYSLSPSDGLEFDGGPESDTIDFSGDTVTLNLNTSTSVDGIRIITAASPAPEPSQIGMLALMGLGLGGLMLRARKAKATLA